MIELGQLLRDARERRGVSLQEAERATRIRARHLAALEEERFDRLPGDAYARAFLREYAEFLGLDARMLVEEYDFRFREEEPVPAPPLPRRRPRRRRAVAVVGVAATAAVAAVIAWRPGGGGAPPAPLLPTSRPAPEQARSPRPAVRPARPVRPAPTRLELVASRGPCWLLVRRGSRAGEQVFQGILVQGERRRFTGSLWIRLGAPWNVDARLNGRPVPLPLDRVGNVLVRSGRLQVEPPG